MVYKKIEVTALNLEKRKSLTITADLEELVKCSSADAVKKAIDKQILDCKIFSKEEMAGLRYQGRKEVLEEWRLLRPEYEKKEEEKAMLLNTNGGRVTPEQIARLGGNEVFVFGSNAAGQHAGGAARYAMEHFGAVLGQGHGLQGKSYAINSMSGLPALAEEVKTFAEYAKQHPAKQFLVTPIGCGIAGYRESQIAPLFECCRDISNVSLPKSFWKVIGAPEPEGYDLERFINAQEHAYPDALEEMRNGRKTGHWIWYIFPQQKGLGHSYNSQYYGLDGVGEAKAYLQHPVLGARLREICQAVLDNRDKDIHYIMGSGIDVLKLRTSMALFDQVSPNDIFEKVLNTFFSR